MSVPGFTIPPLWGKRKEIQIMTAIQPVPSLTIAGFVFSLLVTFILPVVLLFVLKKKLQVRYADFFIGCAVFVIFATLLEQILHAVVFLLTGTALQKNIFLYGLYGGLAAATFEETGRFIAMKFFMKNTLSKRSAVMYGAGHGGIEAILVVGFMYVYNMIYAVMINSGSMEASLAALDPEIAQQTIKVLEPLWTTPSYIFFLAGIERILAICLQIALSVIIYKAVKGKKVFFLVAFGIHFFVDFAAVVASNLLPLVAVEIIVLILTAAACYLAFRLYKEEKDA